MLVNEFPCQHFQRMPRLSVRENVGDDKVPGTEPPLRFLKRRPRRQVKADNLLCLGRRTHPPLDKFRMKIVLPVLLLIFDFATILPMK